MVIEDHWMKNRNFKDINYLFETETEKKLFIQLRNKKLLFFDFSFPPDDNSLGFNDEE